MLYRRDGVSPGTSNASNRNASDRKVTCGHNRRQGSFGMSGIGNSLLVQRSASVGREGLQYKRVFSSLIGLGGAKLPLDHEARPLRSVRIREQCYGDILEAQL